MLIFSTQKGTEKGPFLFSLSELVHLIKKNIFFFLNTNLHVMHINIFLEIQSDLIFKDSIIL